MPVTVGKSLFTERQNVSFNFKFKDFFFFSVYKFIQLCVTKIIVKKNIYIYFPPTISLIQMQEKSGYRQHLKKEKKKEKKTRVKENEVKPWN